MEVVQAWAPVRKDPVPKGHRDGDSCDRCTRVFQEVTKVSVSGKLHVAGNTDGGIGKCAHR